jgi:hypothetical protein
MPSMVVHKTAAQNARYVRAISGIKEIPRKSLEKTNRF